MYSSASSLAMADRYCGLLSNFNAISKFVPETGGRSLFDGQVYRIRRLRLSSVHASISGTRKKKSEETIRKEISVVMAQLAQLSPNSQQTLGSVLKKYGKKLGPECVVGALWEMIRKNDWVRAIEAFDTLRNQSYYEQDPLIYAHLINIAGKANQLTSAQELFDAMSAHYCPRTTAVYTALIDMYGRHNKIDEALYYFMEAKQSPDSFPDESTYCALLRALCRCGMMEHSERLFQEMPDNGCLQNGVSFNIMIDGYGRRGDMDAMQGRFLDMCSSGMKPDTWTYNALIRNFGRHGRMEDMEVCFESMQVNGCPPDQFTLQGLIEGYAKWGHMQKMKRCMQHMFRNKYRVGLAVLNTVIDALGKEQDLAAMEAWYQKLSYAKLTPNQATFASMISAYGKARQGGQVSRVMADMKKMGVKAEVQVYNALFEAYGSLGDMEKVNSLLQNMQADGVEPDRLTYRTLVVTYARESMVGRMEQVLREMKSAGGMRGSLSFFNAVLGAYARSGDPQKARTLWREMVWAGVKPNEESFNLLVVAYCRGSDPGGMVQAMGEMERARCAVAEETYCATVELFAGEGMVAEMEEQLAGMEEEGYTPPLRVLNRVILAYGEAGMKQEAMDVLGFALYKGMVPQAETFLSLLTACGCPALVGRCADELAIVECLTAVDEFSAALTALLCILAVCLTWQEAQLPLSWMEEVDRGRMRHLCLLLQEQPYAGGRGGHDGGGINHSDASGLAFLQKARNEALWQGVMSSLHAIHPGNRVSEMLPLFYCSLMAALWNFGLREKAAQVLKEGMSQGVVAEGSSFTKKEWRMDLGLMRPPSHQLALSVWLLECRRRAMSQHMSPTAAAVIAGWKEEGKGDSPAGTLLGELNSPFEHSEGGELRARGDAFIDWLLSAAILDELLVDAIVPCPGSALKR